MGDSFTHQMSEYLSFRLNENSCDAALVLEHNIRNQNVLARRSEDVGTATKKNT